MEQKLNLIKRLLLTIFITEFTLFQILQAELDKNALPDVEEGFQINFFVKEPHIINPSSLCFDKKGQLYVGAGPQYRHPKEDSPTDYIKILIDADNDGVAETVKTFAEGLNCVQAMAWKGNELWVANAPELTVLRDTDGDDVADEYQIIYTGLNNLRHSVHGLNWGPDGWLYFTMGNTWVKPNAPKPIRDLQGIKSNDKTQYPLTKVYTKETYPKSFHPLNKQEMEGGIFRCRPGGYDLELFARGMRNPWDMCMDSGFNWLATDNDPGRPGERIFMPIQHGHYSMRHPWKFDWMGKHIAVAPSSDLFPSVSGSGTGVAYYTSDHFPKRYRDHYLIADWTNNCIFLYNPKWVGALQVPAETKRKIVDGGTTQGGDLGYKGAKGRSLFRPTDIEIGPDGALYIAGWGSVYGTEYVPKEKWTPEENAKYQGRVFRLTHKDSPLISRKIWDKVKRKKDIKTWSFKELIEDLGSNVHVWRVHSQDELVRRGKAIRDELIAAILSGKLNETQATWAIWAVGHIDRKNNNNEEEWNIEKFADDQWSLKGKTINTYKLNIRVQATRILGETEISTATPKLIKLLSDEEPRIRLAAIGSLDRIGWGNNSDTILDAIAYETDRVTFYSNWQVMRRHLSKEKRYELLKEERIGLRRMAALSLMEEGDRDLQKRADEILGNGITIAGNPLKSLTISASKEHFRESTKVTFAASSPGDIRYTLNGTEPTSKNSLKADKELTLVTSATLKAAVFKGEQRTSEVESLDLHKISDSEWQDRLFVQNIRGEGSANFYPAQLDGLQRGTLVYKDRNYTFTEIPETLAGATHIRTFNDDKSHTNDEFLHFDINLPSTLYLAYDGRTTPPKELVKGMEKTSMVIRISNGELFPVYRRMVQAGKVVIGSNKMNGTGGESMYQIFLTKTGLKKTNITAAANAMGKADTKHGEEIFFGRGTCLACHQVKGKGVPLGPDLNGINKRRDTDYVIRSILLPDEYIVEGFQQTSLELEGGRKLFGMIQEETAQSLKIYLLTGEKISVNTNDIIKRSDAKNSSMPSSFSHTMSAQDVADVTAWIMQLQ
mgnify:FL=1